MAEIWLTEREVEKRRQKLDYLKGERRLEIAEMLKIARGFGDLSENAEYDAAKNEQAKNEYDIAVLEDELQHVHIIDETTLASGGVNIGTSVTVRNAKNGFETTYQIVGTTEADPRKGKISNESPIGAALIGHKAGEKVDVHTPGGLLELEIVCIN
ncbi:MAG: transcription elongation factor GreA [Clostridia bacterium]|jgi:transcription elongation factor GreA|nr:transcription elongation factor GreA [Clostridia bacterium]